ncbi:MAG: tetratricopeptide repeat protein, partial [Saprospiraceae bacterium]
MNANSKKNILLLSLFWLLSFTLLAQNDTILSDDLYYEGKELYYDGNYPAALEKLKSALALRRKIYGENHVQVEKAYQRIGKVYMKLRNHAPALAALERALAIAEKIEAPDSEAITDLYTLFGNTYSQMYDPEKSDRYYEKAITIYAEKYGPQSSEIGKMYMNQGLNSLKVRNYRATDQNFQKAFDCFQKSSKPKSKDMYRIYSNYALLFTRRGEYERALAYTKQALEIKLLHYDSLHPSVAKYYMNLGTIYENQGNYEAALVHKKKSLLIDQKALGEFHPETAGNYAELAGVYASMNKLDTALVLFQKSNAIQEKMMDPTHAYVLAGYFDMAAIYEEQNNYDQALKFYRLILARAQQRSYLPRPLMADTYRRMARVYLQQENFPKALLTIDQGLQIMAPGFKIDASNHYANPSLEQIEVLTKGFSLLEKKANILQLKFERHEQRTDLEQALKTSELAIRIVDDLKQSYQSADAKKFLNYRTAKVYEAAVEQAFAMYRLTNDGSFLYKAFQFSEKSKASILWQTVNDAYALEQSSIPAEKLKTMKMLEQKINALESASRGKESSNSLQEILKLKGEYRQLIKSLEQENPQYYELKYATTKIALETLQAKMPTQETTLLEFFCSQRKIFAFVLSKNDLQAFEIPMPADLNEKVLALRGKNIDAILLQENTTKHYLTQLTDLYELLIAPLQPVLAKAQNLIVVPHGIFHFLSFESLAP